MLLFLFFVLIFLLLSRCRNNGGGFYRYILFRPPPVNSRSATQVFSTSKLGPPLSPSPLPLHTRGSSRSCGQSDS